MDSADMVRHYLRGQNLEQLGKIDEAIEVYEVAIQGAFDAAGPYDRLIDLYSGRALHLEVARVAEAALDHVRTYEDKLSWYDEVARSARAAAKKVPEAAPKDRS